MGLFSGISNALFGTKKAYDTSGQVNATNQATDLQREMYQKSLELNQPFYDIGVSGAGNLAERLGVGGDQNSPIYGSLTKGYDYQDYINSPAYNFIKGEGQQAIDRAMAAQGKTLSPEAVKELQRYNQGLASQYYQQGLDNFNTEQNSIYNRLAGIAGAGQTAAGSNISSGANYGNTYSGLVTGLADAQSAARIGRSSAGQSMFNTILGGAGAIWGSDERLKYNIQPDGKENGCQMYTFNYIGMPKTTYRGVIAQDILKTNKDAVVESNGYYMVNYDKLGLKMSVVN